MEIRQPYFFLQDDNADSYICQYVYSIESVIKGEFPLYNFRQFAGIDFLGKGQTGQLNLLVYIGGALSYLFLGHLFGTVDFVAALYLILGAIGFYLLLNKMKLSSVASLMGALTWSFNSFSIYCGSNWIIAIILTGCFPWMVVSSLYMMKNYKVKSIALSAIAKTFLVYGGHPQYFIYAVIFDYLFSICFILFNEKKVNKRIESLKFTLFYFLSGLLTALWSLPLLVPMFNTMRYSSTRSQALVFEDFIAHLYGVSDFFRALFYPLSQQDADNEGVIYVLNALHKNMSHIGYIMFVAAVLGIVIVITRHRSNDERSKKAVVSILTCLPPLIISFLWATSIIFNIIVYFIPVLNRFRYPFKLMQYALFFIIMVASISLDYAFSTVKKGKEAILRRVKVLLVVVQIVNLVLIYIILPVRFFGMYSTSEKPYHDDSLELLSGSRYVFVGDSFSFWDTDLGKRVSHDVVAGLGYNYATVLGLNSITGYDVLLSDETYYSLPIIVDDLFDASGNVFPYQNLVEDMRSHGVAYYVCLLDWKQPIEEFLFPYGITQCYEDDVKAIFYDQFAEPLVFASDDYYSYPLCFEEHINHIEIVTPESFEGGMVVANYTHNSNFIATVDGEEVDISDPGDFSKMIIDSVTPGQHRILLTYVDNTFKYCVIISFGVTAILTVSYLVMRNCKKQIVA
ncbi:MAG: hypothetical protein MJ094_00280 [Saccharofermentans sp.]|nr:hypothetical protein [Saccharofermentans sp.]